MVFQPLTVLRPFFLLFTQSVDIKLSFPVFIWLFHLALRLLGHDVANKSPYQYPTNYH